VVDFTQRGHTLGSLSVAEVHVFVRMMLIGPSPVCVVQHPKQSQFFGTNAAQ
jgi:hypothetical protein